MILSRLGGWPIRSKEEIEIRELKRLLYLVIKCCGGEFVIPFQRIEDEPISRISKDIDPRNRNIILKTFKLKEGDKMLLEPKKVKCGEGKKGRDKHIVLNAALNELGMLPDKVEKLYESIVGGSSPEESEMDKVDPLSLSNILVNSPERILEAIRQIEETLNKIRTELF
jgi:hypothetical protein